MPRLIPVMLVHGFNGIPGDWVERGFVAGLVERGGLRPDFVRLFHYGVDEDGAYNNRGDIRQVASRLAGAGLESGARLHCSVDQLSADSRAAGGPAGVTLIAHSMGGLVSRYYLSRAEPDRFGTHYRGNVGRLIEIATPNLGVELAHLATSIQRNRLTWMLLRCLERLGLAPGRPALCWHAVEQELIRAQFEVRTTLLPELAGGEARLLLADTPVYAQLRPDSPLLAQLNVAGAMPDSVRCHVLYGDVLVRLRVRLSERGRRLWERSVSFGDLLVPVDSARAIPHVGASAYPFLSEALIDLVVRGLPGAGATRRFSDILPDCSHANLLGNRAVQDTVLALLSG